MASNSKDKCLKKTNLLVYPEDEQKTTRRLPCGKASKPSFKIPICTAKPKQIKICTGAELKKMRPPKVCKCDKALARRGRGVLGLVGFGLKAALAAAAWYVTYDMGIWGSSDDTHEIYRSYCKIIKGPCSPKSEKWEPVQCTAEKELMKIPKISAFAHCDRPPIEIQRQLYNIQNYWNQAVACLFTGIRDFPFNIIDKFSKEEKQEVKKEERKCVPYSELPEEEREELIQNAYKK